MPVAGCIRLRVILNSVRRREEGKDGLARYSISFQSGCSRNTANTELAVAGSPDLAARGVRCAIFRQQLPWKRQRQHRTRPIAARSAWKQTCKRCAAITSDGQDPDGNVVATHGEHPHLPSPP